MILTANSLKDIEKIIPSNVTIMDLKNKIRLNKKEKNTHWM